MRALRIAVQGHAEKDKMEPVGLATPREPTFGYRKPYEEL